MEKGYHKALDLAMSDSGLRLGFCLDRGDDKVAGAGANQIGIPRGSTGCLKVLTIMRGGGGICRREIFTSYGTQPEF